MCDLKIKGYGFGGGKPHICVPIVERGAREVISEAEALIGRGTAMIEWRADYFSDEIGRASCRERVLAGV